MKRRLFIESSSAALATSLLAACGGGGGGGEGVAQATAVEPAASQGNGTGTGSGGTGAPASQAQQASAPAPANGVAYPFAARIDAYTTGIKPTVASNAQMDETVRTCYDQWKAAQLKTFPDFTGHDGQRVSGAKFIRFNNNFATVSEGVAYAMLIFVVMAGHDPEARAHFDGLFKTVRARPAYGHGGTHGKYLFEWRLGFDGSSQGGGWNALDGDQDIAMALLMAHRQWGSTSGVNYLQEAIHTINAMKAINHAPSGEPRGPAGQRHSSRTSDYMVGHFRAFRKATGDAFWDQAITRCADLVELMQSKFSNGTGLTPDFIIDVSTGNPIPSDGTGPNRGGWVEGPWEGTYGPNACRNPWRWGTDVVFSGDQRWANICRRMMNFFVQDTGGNPARVAPGYQLSGTASERSYSPEGMIGPLLCAAMVDPAYQTFLNALWTWNANNFTTDYYDSELQLIPMLVASGNWWNP